MYPKIGLPEQIKGNIQITQRFLLNSKDSNELRIQVNDLRKQISDNNWLSQEDLLEKLNNRTIVTCKSTMFERIFKGKHRTYEMTNFSKEIIVSTCLIADDDIIIPRTEDVDSFYHGITIPKGTNLSQEFKQSITLDDEIFDLNSSSILQIKREESIEEVSYSIQTDYISINIPQSNEKLWGKLRKLNGIEGIKNLLISSVFIPAIIVFLQEIRDGDLGGGNVEEYIRKSLGVDIDIDLKEHLNVNDTTLLENANTVINHFHTEKLIEKSIIELHEIMQIP